MKSLKAFFIYVLLFAASCIVVSCDLLGRGNGDDDGDGNGDGGDDVEVVYDTLQVRFTNLDEAVLQKVQCYYSYLAGEENGVYRNPSEPAFEVSGGVCRFAVPENCESRVAFCLYDYDDPNYASISDRVSWFSASSGTGMMGGDFLVAFLDRSEGFFDTVHEVSLFSVASRISLKVKVTDPDGNPVPMNKYISSFEICFNEVARDMLIYSPTTINCTRTSVIKLSDSVYEEDSDEYVYEPFYVLSCEEVPPTAVTMDLKTVLEDQINGMECGNFAFAPGKEYEVEAVVAVDGGPAVEVVDVNFTVKEIEIEL